MLCCDGCRHDGEVKNVHVDVHALRRYQNQLGALVRLYEQRVNWLNTGSRRLWGTLAERNLVFLVDLALANAKYIIHIQNSIRLGTPLSSYHSLNELLQ